jgi:hypothetical protein
MTDLTKFQVVRKLPNLIQLVGVYESMHRAKFIMQKAKLHNSSGEYAIQPIKATN